MLTQHDTAPRSRDTTQVFSISALYCQVQSSAVCTQNRGRHILFHACMSSQKCPFDAIMIINLPKDLESCTTHRYGPNSFKLHR